ncbi:MAG: hypothetical protein ABIG39_03220 [Candidatus Micrarchaeota archaeon]
MGIQLKPLVSSPKDCPTLNGSDAHNCFISFAMRRNDPELCNRIDNNYYKDKCYSKFSGSSTESLCEKMATPNSRGDCFFDEAISKGTPELCKQAALESFPHRGSDRCFFRYAIKTEEREICDYIVAPERKGECIYSLASEPGDCDTNQTDVSEQCLIRMAMNRQDAHICDYLTDLRDDCYLQIAIMSGNPELCELLHDQEIRAACIEETG